MPDRADGPPSDSLPACVVCRQSVDVMSADVFALLPGGRYWIHMPCAIKVTNDDRKTRPLLFREISHDG